MLCVDVVNAARAATSGGTRGGDGHRRHGLHACITGQRHQLPGAGSAGVGLIGKDVSRADEGCHAPRTITIGHPIH